MKNFLLNCLDFLSSLFILFVFFVCVIVALAVCYTFPNVGIIAGIASVATAIILALKNKKNK